MELKRILVIIGICSIIAPLHQAGADIITYWPSFSEWNSITQNLLPYWDTKDDQSPDTLDLVGANTHYTNSSGYYYYAPDSVANSSGDIVDGSLMFRMRVGGYKANPQTVWQFLIDTDGDSSNVEWIMQLDLSGANSVYLAKTATGGPTLSDITVASNVWSAAETDTFVSWQNLADDKLPANPANTDYNKNKGGDVFLDFAMPWSAFTNATGVSNPGSVRVVLTTSATHSGVNKDAPLGGDLASNISDLLSDSIPEPTVAILIVTFGSSLFLGRRLFGKSGENS